MVSLRILANPLKCVNCTKADFDIRLQHFPFCAVIIVLCVFPRRPKLLHRFGKQIGVVTIAGAVEVALGDDGAPYDEGGTEDGEEDEADIADGFVIAQSKRLEEPRNGPDAADNANQSEQRNKDDHQPQRPTWHFLALWPFDRPVIVWWASAHCS